MAAFGTDGRCLMRTLQQELDDPSAEDCGRCSICTGPRYAAPLDPPLVEQAQRYLRSSPVELEVRKMAPDASGTQRKIPDEVRISPGWSLSRLGDGGWWPVVERGLSDARSIRSSSPDSPICCAFADVRADWVTSVPSVRLGDTLVRLGERLAGELAVPYLELLARHEQRPPQWEMANAVQQAANVRGASSCSTPPARHRDTARRRAHLRLDAREVGGQLRRAGAERIVPLVLGTLA